MIVENTLIVILKTFGYPVFRQGSLTEKQPYPATFITWWNRIEEGTVFSDNKTIEVEHSFDINVYSTSTETIYSLINQIRSTLKENGFVVPDRGHDIASDEPTHTGRGTTAIFLQTDDIIE